ncbi:MAG: hypothetical protein F3745_06355 [Nitrospinae bacterium]|nr:hypothetical protein [Nitrospinota bacterium]
MICPKCNFEQPDSDTCIHCGVIFAKYQAYLGRQNKSNDENNIESEEGDLTNKIPNRFAFLNYPWYPVSTPTFTFLSLLFFLHVVFFPKTTQIEDWSLFTGLIHNVNLVFHEAGHVLFGLFGNNTLMVLGGSLNQLLIPFIAFASFYYKRDRGGSAFALLWFFGNFIDVGIYMADGRFLKLPLIGGLGMEAHDWRNLFNHFDLWGVDQMLANLVFYLGWLGILLAWIWLSNSWRSDRKKV